jgi:cobalt-zinc-cadmium efflux system outer membrane protein
VSLALLATLGVSYSHAQSPPILTRDAAVTWALQNNPELAALRQQHGIAAAAVVIANTYPFNPVWDGKVRAASGPESAGITNRVSNEHKVLLDLEVRGQGQHRRQAADAALTRTDWEIAFQEATLAVRVLRAFDAVLYQQNKLELTREALRLNEQAAEQVSVLAAQGVVHAADVIVARTEVNDSRAQVGAAELAYEKARHELHRALGVVEGAFTIQGSLEAGSTTKDTEVLLSAALEQRADLHSRRAAIEEAEARLRLAVADRYGNPNVGPAYEYDPTRISLIGVQFTVPLPVLNTHRGEIEQREAERTRAALELRQTEVAVRQDLEAALGRLHAARRWSELYRTQVLPDLQKSLSEIQRLFTLGQPGVDVLRVLDIRRKALKARDSYLDALWEVRQAQADVAAAIGDPRAALIATEAGRSQPVNPVTPAKSGSH